mmetsp:Transcript_37554/g.62252  ORF Transcript_37554/g.62252 Transcript_37554/m.62252 type:complete len:377 (-) Transcript_37554:10-1140(-)
MSTHRSTRFFQDLQAFTSAIDRDVKDIRSNLQKKPLGDDEGGYAQAFLKGLNDQAAEIEDVISRLQACTLDAHSFDQLLSNCTALCTENAKAIEAIETRMVQFGYKRDSFRPLQQTSTAQQQQQQQQQQPEVSEPTMTLNQKGPTAMAETRAEPSTPAVKRTFFTAEPKTPCLEDMQLSSYALEAIMKKDTPHQPKQSYDTDPYGGSQKYAAPRSFDTPLANLSKHSYSTDPAPSIPQPKLSSAAPAKENMAPQQTFSSAPGTPGFELTQSLDSMFPLMPLLSTGEYSGLPKYLTGQVSLVVLNQCIERLNAVMTDKRFENDDADSDHLSQKEIDKIVSLDSKTKAVVLMLMTTKRLLAKKAGTETIYHLQTPKTT